MGCVVKFGLELDLSKIWAGDLVGFGSPPQPPPPKPFQNSLTRKLTLNKCWK